MAKTAGIDLGTTNSVIAVLDNGKPLIIPNREGFRTTPSIVAFIEGGGILVGEDAKNQAITNTQRTVHSIKRKMGTGHKERIGNKSTSEYLRTPEEISAKILTKLVEEASEYVGEKISSAVITVPAYFNDAQRTATRNAGKIAGLDVIRIINEPTAAALAYKRNSYTSKTILVFDLGGGTFDVSILSVDEGIFKVVATSGNSALGGDDWDSEIAFWLAKEFQMEHEIDLTKNVQTLKRLKDASEKAKIELSHQSKVSILIPFIASNENRQIHLHQTLTIEKFESLTEHLLKKCVHPFTRVMKDANVIGKDIDEVILVGGSTRMPCIENLVENLSGQKPKKAVNADEIVAEGAAIQAGIISGEITNALLLDITPLSLGIEVKGEKFAKLVNRNAPIPTRKTETFTTTIDNQEAVNIHVLQGERSLARYNKTLGRFILDGILPAPAGVPQINVMFDIDVNGIVDVTATDKASGKTQSIKITGQCHLSEKEINKIIKESQKDNSVGGYI